MGTFFMPLTLRLPLPSSSSSSSISKPKHTAPNNSPLFCLRNSGDAKGLHKKRLEDSKNEDMSKVCYFCFKLKHVLLCSFNFQFYSPLSLFLKYFNSLLIVLFYFSPYLGITRTRNVVIFGNCSERLSKTYYT